MIPSETQFPTSNVRTQTPGISEYKDLVNGPSSPQSKALSSRAAYPGGSDSIVGRNDSNPDSKSPTLKFG